MGDSIVLVEIATKIYGVESNAIKEVTNATNITYVPKAPQYIEGIIKIKGEIIAVINLAKFFKLTNESAIRQLIIIGKAGKKFAIIVDKIQEIGYIKGEMLSPKEKYEKGQIVFDNKYISVLDLEKLEVL